MKEPPNINESGPVEAKAIRARPSHPPTAASGRWPSDSISSLDQRMVGSRIGEQPKQRNETSTLADKCGGFVTDWD